MNESDKRDELYWLDIYIQEEAEEAANAEEYAKKADEEKNDEQMRREKQELDQHIDDILKRANEMSPRSQFLTRLQSEAESRQNEYEQQLKKQWQNEYDEKVARVIGEITVRTEKLMREDQHALRCENQVLRDSLKAKSDENERLRQRLSNETKKRKRVVEEHTRRGEVSTF